MLDVLIKNTKIVDGTGKDAFLGDVGIKGEKIVKLGSIDEDAEITIDGTNLVTCPGFVDPHSHADKYIIGNAGAENLVAQGITTFAGGNCGSSIAPLSENDFSRNLVEKSIPNVDANWRSFGQWLNCVEDNGISVNYAPLVGHNTVRGAVVGSDFQRKSSSDEIQEIKKHVTEAMESGAFGMSVGLDPAMLGHFAEREEILELLKIIKEFDGVFAPHTRHHQNQWPMNDTDKDAYGLFQGPAGEIITGRYHGLLEAVEMCGEVGGVKTHIAHLTPAYLIPQPHPESLDEALARATLEDIIDSPRNEGLDITFNVIAWAQSLGSLKLIVDEFLNTDLLLPDWLIALTKEEFVEGLKSKDFRKRVKDVIFSGKFKFGMIHPVTDPYWMDCYKIIQCGNKEFENKTIGEIARKRQVNNIFNAVYNESIEILFDILVEDPKTSWALVLDKREYRALSTFLKHPAGMPCTDTVACLSTTRGQEGNSKYGAPPLIFGLYPYYLRTFVKEKGVLTLEEAIMKATSVPAQDVLGLKDRGRIAEGCFADIVVLDLDNLQEKNDFTKPYQPPDGIEYVLVNGSIAYKEMSHTGVLSGKVLYRPRSKSFFQTPSQPVQKLNRR